MIGNRTWAGLGAIGLTVAAITVSPASPVVPTPAPNRIAANEAAAIQSLREVAAAQARFRAAVDVDTNCDGVGEYGYFAELAGSKAMRVGPPGACTPQAGYSPQDILTPPLLRPEFGEVAYSCVVHRGYLFQIWLPTQTYGGGPIDAQREDCTGGKMAAPFPDPVNGARMWCCYAWPINYNETGQRAFFINQRGVILECSNQIAFPFSGYYPPLNCNYRPYFDEAYSAPSDMGSPLRIGVPNANGSIWLPVH